MSHKQNDILYDRAKFVMDYFTGTLWEKLIEQAYKENDLEKLDRLVREAEADMFNLEYRPEKEPLTDDEIESVARDSITIDWKDVPF